MESKKYGFQGTISPSNIIKELSENWEQNNILYSIENSVFKAEFDTEEQEEEAKKIANIHIAAWNFTNNTHLVVDFNHSWKPGENGAKNYSLRLTENLKISDSNSIIHKANSERGLYVIGKFYSISFKENSSLVDKASRDDALREALEFYSEEVTDSKRPLYGIFKAVETLTKHLNKEYPQKGRKVLGKLAGENERFVQDIMESADFQRHANPRAKRKLSDEECKNRTKKLILAYANSL